MQFAIVRDIFEYHPELIVHPVNCQGLCRDGLSRQLKKAWPDYFREYTRLCLRKKLQPGQATFFDLGTMLSTRYIVTLTVRDHWNEPLQPTVVKPALGALLDQVASHRVSTLAIPVLKGTPEGWLKAQFENFFAPFPDAGLAQVYFFEND